MTARNAHNQFDVILIGGGLGTSSAARMLARAGQSVAMLSGAGRSRSLEADGGLVDPALVEEAFGPGAPLGPLVTQWRPFTAPTVESHPTFGPVEATPERRSFRRLELERWAVDRAIDAGAVWLQGFIEGTVLPGPDDRLALKDEAGDQTIEAATIALCEGSDPRIAMRAGLRPDYPPEEQIHFARAIIARPSGPVVTTGRTRTSWGMPIGVTVTPLGSVTLVSVDARIENVMRGARSTQEALFELLTSPLGMELGLDGERLHTGIELSAMRSSGEGLRMSQAGLLLGIDASGMLDMRGTSRADITIRSGLRLAEYVADPDATGWQAFATPLITEIRAPDPRWHHSGKTGYIEEGMAPGAVRGAVSRLARGLADRFRER